MATMEKYEADIRVFKWNVKASEKIPISSLSWLFLIRLKTCIPDKNHPTGCCWHSEAKVGLDSKARAWKLTSFMRTFKLIRAALKKFGFLGACKDLNKFALQIAIDLRCKFLFSRDILYGQGPKPVIFLDLQVTMGGEACQSVSFTNTAVASGYDEEKWIHEVDLKSEQIEGTLKHWLGEYVEESKGLDEVRAGLMIKPSLDQYHDSSSANSEVEECSICWNRLHKPNDMIIESPCSHTFHRICMINWLLRSNSCPLCRSPCATLI